MTLPATTLLGALGERELLHHIQARVPAAAGVAVGIGDAAAVVEIGPLALVTTDSLVEGVHFLREATPPRLLGRKALSVNLSDVAATGGLARYATVSLCLPAEIDLTWLDSLYDGLLERAAEADVGLVGGNLARRADGIVVDVTLLGDAGPLLLRSGARAGDHVVVTGTLGAAAEGVRLLAEGARLDDDGELRASGPWTDSSRPALLACLRAQLDPRPPLAFSRAIAERGLAHGGMDLSDGLSSDLAELCRQSGVSAVIAAAAIPIDARAASLEHARGGDPLALALHGGEDYELLLAVGRDELATLVELGRVWGVEVRAIGEFGAGESRVTIKDASGERPLLPGGHDHFHAPGL